VPACTIGAGSGHRKLNNSPLESPRHVVRRRNPAKESSIAAPAKTLAKRPA